jgi:methionyl-tRNA formyltransferase
VILCLAGKNDIAVDCTSHVLAERLVDARDVVCMFNQTDTGRDGFQKSFRRFAGEKGLREVEQSELHARDDLVLVSLEFDRLLPIARYRSPQLFNIHFSALPKFRGMYTSAWPILRGEPESGVTLHVIDEGIDTGDVIAQIRFPIGPEDTARDLYLKYIEHGIRLFKANIRGLIADRYERRPQRESDASYFSRGSIDYASVVIELDRAAADVKNQIRAFTFAEYQLPRVHGLAVDRAEILGRESSMPAGSLVEATADNVVVATRDFDVRLRRAE